MKNTYLPEANIPNSMAYKLASKERGNSNLTKAKSLNRKVLMLEKPTKAVKDRLFDAKAAAKFLEIDLNLFNKHKRSGNIDFIIRSGKAHFYESVLNKFEVTHGPLFCID